MLFFVTVFYFLFYVFYIFLLKQEMFLIVFTQQTNEIHNWYQTRPCSASSRRARMENSKKCTRTYGGSRNWPMRPVCELCRSLLPWQWYYFCSQLRLTTAVVLMVHVTTSWAPLGPGALAGFPPVAIDKSSRKRYHSRYRRRLKTLKTRSWKSSGPLVGPKVRPRGK